MTPPITEAERTGYAAAQARGGKLPHIEDWVRVLRAGHATAAELPVLTPAEWEELTRGEWI
jgi:hypothetical protein